MKEPTAIPAAFPEHITRTVPVVPTPPRTDEKLNGRTSTKELADREEPKMRESGRAHGREETIRVRWGLAGDEAQIAEPLELNGMGRNLASEERFVAAAKPGGEVLAALGSPYRHKELPTGGWWRVVALLGVLATPSFRDFREAGRETDRSRRSRPR